MIKKSFLMVLYILSIILLSSTAYAKSSRVVRYYGTEITVMSPPLAPETNEWGGYIDVYFDSDNEPEMLVRQGEELYLSYKQGPNEKGVTSYYVDGSDDKEFCVAKNGTVWFGYMTRMQGYGMIGGFNMLTIEYYSR